MVNVKFKCIDIVGRNSVLVTHGGLPLNPQIKFVIPPTINHTVLIILVQRIQYWIN